MRVLPYSVASMNAEPPPARAPWPTRAWKTLWLTLCLYSETDGEQRAASFAYYAFFALFPLVLLFVSVGSTFLDGNRVSAAVIDFVARYIPVESDQQNIVVETINGVLRSRKGAGLVAVLGLAWSSLRFFQSLVRGVNRAWGTHEYSWWRLPLQNALMVGIVASALLIGVVAPTVLDAVQAFVWQHHITVGVDALVVLFRVLRFLIPFVVLFYGFSMFYKFAPRRRTSFSEVWLAALLVTLALQGLQSLFVFYAKNFGHFNALYGTFGGVIALLMWIYLSGSIIILGGCLCVAQAEVAGKIQHTPPSDS